MSLFFTSGYYYFNCSYGKVTRILKTDNQRLKKKKTFHSVNQPFRNYELYIPSLFSSNEKENVVVQSWN